MTIRNILSRHRDAKHIAEDLKSFEGEGFSLEVNIGKLSDTQISQTYKGDDTKNINWSPEDIKKIQDSLDQVYAQTQVLSIKIEPKSERICAFTISREALMDFEDAVDFKTSLDQFLSVYEQAMPITTLRHGNPATPEFSMPHVPANGRSMHVLECNLYTGEANGILSLPYFNQNVSATDSRLVKYENESFKSMLLAVTSDMDNRVRMELNKVALIKEMAVSTTFMPICLSLKISDVESGLAARMHYGIKRFENNYVDSVAFIAEQAKAGYLRNDVAVVDIRMAAYILAPIQAVRDSLYENDED